MTDDVGVNIMQRVFDSLSTERGTSVHDLTLAVRVSRESIIRALERLKAQRALQPATRDERGIWLYRRRTDALRPMDRRGARQMQQEAA